MILLMITLIAALFFGSMHQALMEAFSNPMWVFEEEQQPTERERLEMENEEFSWGHNIRNYVED